MTDIPPVSDRPFNQELKGVFGEFGAGAGVQALYLQSAIEPAKLDRISLLSDIEGSEKWSVRDLFQREVDQKRVQTRLMPYLAETDKVKFFNPLTLTLMPDEPDSLKRRVPRLDETTLEEDGFAWRTVTCAREYRLRWVEHNPEWASLAWNDSVLKLVAIDGQHRLSAMKRLWDDHQAPHRYEMQYWRVPVVVVIFRGEDDAKSLPPLVEVVRRIFVYINTTAQVVSPARQILLSDESPAAICAQEVIERAHRNDRLPLDQQEKMTLPLLCYDWRGAESDGRAVRAPAALKGVEEIRDWLSHYILRCGAGTGGGHDEFTSIVRKTLGIPTRGPLDKAFSNGRLDHRTSQMLREHARGHLLPYFEQVMETFTPYRQYVADLRRLESRYCHGSSADLARHAFDELRFGVCRANESVSDSVRHERREITIEIERLKEKHLRVLLRQDNGMRGVMCAYGYLRGCFRDPPWSEYTPRFVRALNLLDANGWLDPDRPRSREHLTHIVQDHAGTVVNYRIQDAENALGAYLALLVAAYGGSWPDSWTRRWRSERELLFDRLEATALRGYRREVRARLREEGKLTLRELNEAVKQEAGERAQLHNRKLREAIARVRETYRGC